MGRRRKEAPLRGFVLSSGRITIPQQLRKKRNIEQGDVFEILEQGEDWVKIKFMKVP